MRFILVVIFLVVFFTISIPLYLIEWIIGRFNRRAMVASSQAIVSAAFRVLLFFAGVKYKVIGRENVPKEEAVVYISNHRSYFDAAIAYATVPTLTSFLSKKELGRIPFLSTWMRLLQCLFLDRKDTRQGLKTVLKGIDLVKDGYSVFIAPEGTRNHEREMLPFKEGSFKIAEKTGCAIIPVAISNSDEIFENHEPWVRATHVVIEYGVPIYPKELSKEEMKFLGSHVRSVIQEMLNRNEALI